MANRASLRPGRPSPRLPSPQPPAITQAHLSRCVPRFPPPRGDAFSGRATHAPRPAPLTLPSRENRGCLGDALPAALTDFNNYPAAPERPLPASSSKPEGSLATIPTASVGRHRREGTPGKMPERLAGAHGAHGQHRARNLELRGLCRGSLVPITDSSSFSRLFWNCDRLPPLPPADGCVRPAAFHRPPAFQSMARGGGPGSSPCRGIAEGRGAARDWTGSAPEPAGVVPAGMRLCRKCA